MNNVQMLRQLLSQGLISQEVYENAIAKITPQEPAKSRNKTELIEGFNRWLIDTEKLTERTVIQYTRIIVSFLEQFKDATFTLDSITVDESNAFIAKAMAKTHTSGRNTFFATAKLFQYLNEEVYGEQRLDSEKLIRQHKANVNKPLEAYTFDELQNILKYASQRSRICVWLCYFGALKKSSLIGFRFKDIDFQRGLATAYTDMERKEVANIFSIPSWLLADIADYIERLREDIVEWNESRRSRNKPMREYSDYLFQTVRATHPGYTIVFQFFKEAVSSYAKANELSSDEYEALSRTMTTETIRNSQIVFRIHEGAHRDYIVNKYGIDNRRYREYAEMAEKIY